MLALIAVLRATVVTHPDVVAFIIKLQVHRSSTFCGCKPGLSIVIAASDGKHWHFAADFLGPLVLFRLKLIIEVARDVEDSQGPTIISLLLHRLEGVAVMMASFCELPVLILIRDCINITICVCHIRHFAKQIQHIFSTNYIM